MARELRKMLEAFPVSENGIAKVSDYYEVEYLYVTLIENTWFPLKGPLLSLEDINSVAAKTFSEIGYVVQPDNIERSTHIFFESGKDSLY